MSIVIGADFVPTDSNAELFRNADIKELFGDDLTAVLSAADYRIFNLEIPLTDKVSPIAKHGPALIAGTDAIRAYTSANVNLLTLANNHILDQGVQGLESTVKVLDDAGISHVGTGNTPEKAAEPVIFRVGDTCVGVYACVEHEFSVVSCSLPGANPYDPLESFDHVANLKAQCDYVIVLYHGGKEHYRYPSPQLQKRCRKFAEKGADLILCQHSHCIGCFEEYQGSTIVYGQGNFLFDDSENECWQTSLLVSVEDDFKVSYIPLLKKGNTVRLADKESSLEIMKEFYHRSEEIKNPEFVEEHYASFADEMMQMYLTACMGKQSFVFRALNKLTKGKIRQTAVRHCYGQKQCLTIWNYVDCEAHRELFVQSLNNYTNK